MIKKWLCVGVFCIQFGALCGANLPWSENTPAQMHTTQDSIASSETALRHTQESIPQESKQSVAQKQETPLPSRTEINSGLLALQNQLNQLNQNLFIFQNSINNRVYQIMDEVQKLKQQCNQLNQALILMNQEMHSVRAVQKP